MEAAEHHTPSAEDAAHTPAAGAAVDVVAVVHTGLRRQGEVDRHNSAARIACCTLAGDTLVVRMLAAVDRTRGREAVVVDRRARSLAAAGMVVAEADKATVVVVRIRRTGPAAEEELARSSAYWRNLFRLWYRRKGRLHREGV